MRCQVERLFGGRPRLSKNDFFATYYQASGIAEDTIYGVQKVLEDELQLDTSRVVPADDLAGNLRVLVDSYSMVDVAIVEGLEKRFGITITDQEAERTRTVHEIIALVHSKRAGDDA